MNQCDDSSTRTRCNFLGVGLELELWSGREEINNLRFERTDEGAPTVRPMPVVPPYM